MAGRKPLFDKKFGEDFIGTVPQTSGVYEVTDADGTVIYVGKARRLRRRLQQYRLARRIKKHHKMRAIIAAASHIRITPCASPLDAEILENRLIQSLRPKLNVAGAFSFLYPCIGLRVEGRTAWICYTTDPAPFESYTFFGAYRSRGIVRPAFLSMLDLLEFLGHREPRSLANKEPKCRFSIAAGFRQLPDAVLGSLRSFLRGDSRLFLEVAILALVERASARRKHEEVQEMIDEMSRFYKFEAKPLRDACRLIGLKSTFIPQSERDRLHLIAREARRALVSSASERQA